MTNLLTKKNVLIISSVYVICLVAMLLFSKCYGGRWCPLNIYKLDYVPVFVFLPLFPSFLLSLTTYKMREEIFASWVNFAKWWVPLSVFAILITPEKAGGFVSIPYQSALALIVTGVFFFISLVLIVWKWFTLRGKK